MSGKMKGITDFFISGRFFLWHFSSKRSENNPFLKIPEQEKKADVVELKMGKAQLILTSNPDRTCPDNFPVFLNSPDVIKDKRFF